MHLQFSRVLLSMQHVQNNGSIYLHVFIVKHGKSPDPSTGKTNFSKKFTLYRSKLLNKWVLIFHF